MTTRRQVLQAGGAVIGRQGFTYAPAISAESVGASGIHMQLLTMPPGAMNRPLGVYSTFLPALSAQLYVNGEASSAKVFPQERGGRRSSSCVLAWSESWTKPKG